MLLPLVQTTAGERLVALRACVDGSAKGALSRCLARLVHRGKPFGGHARVPSTCLSCRGITVRRGVVQQGPVQEVPSPPRPRTA